MTWKSDWPQIYRPRGETRLAVGSGTDRGLGGHSAKSGQASFLEIRRSDRVLSMARAPQSDPSSWLSWPDSRARWIWQSQGPGVASSTTTSRFAPPRLKSPAKPPRSTSGRLSRKNRLDRRRTRIAALIHWLGSAPSCGNGGRSDDRKPSTPVTERRSSGTRWAALQNCPAARPPARPGRA